MRRTLSLVLAVAMMMPVLATVVDAAVGTWLSPQPGQLVPAGKVEVAIGFNTQSEAKVTSLELYVDGQFYARKLLVTPTSRGVCSFWWDAVKAAKGSHDLLVKVFVGTTLISKVSGRGTVGGSSAGLIDTRAPKVMFANIKAGDVLKGLSRVRLDASDDSGQHPMVSLVVDHSLKMLRNTPPYFYDLDTTTYSDGDHKIETYAYDAAGNRSDPSVVTVAFKNGQRKPVVTAMTVSPKPITVVEEDGAVVTVPANISASAKPILRNSAGRTSEPALGAPAASVPAAASEVTAPKVAVTPAAKVPAASASSPTRVLVASLPQNLRSDKLASAVASAPGASEPAAVSEPVVPKVTSGAVSSAPKPVRIAMAPDVRSLKTHPRLSPEIAIPPPAERPSKARIEKRVAPATGKVKARDMIEQLGGIVFWDPISRTVTAIVNGLKIEMRIGSSVATVNGRTMQIGVEPSIVDGRTIIDASVYHQACACVEEAAKSASAN